MYMSDYNWQRNAILELTAPHDLLTIFEAC